MVNMVSTCPVCTPYRASLMTGQYPLTNGLFLNDLCLNSEAMYYCQRFINKPGMIQGISANGIWMGMAGRHIFPKERRQGFDYWKVLECTHNYNRSFYYDNDNPERKTWPGYDVFAQTKDAQKLYPQACRER